MGGTLAHIREMRNANKILGRQPQNGSQKIGSEGMDWTELNQNEGQWLAFVYTAMNTVVP
jgi:hypothetical protein